ncbi:cyclin-dependent kinase 2 (nucleomorph) [Chroomonas mesostigmatica CCMP1168]|uniref:Cyclin-dependent kinase 2 n=1 Tax=Chroomonas mesostigmatica CCMP1168 TaxID=1195612 RepID=J7GB69_9CRYP|nr:cyclin-dependent kinase 2 [Chroomonas mesostigmatica CCMP1168]|mmetsp:Transcript_38552/g.94842  ORF Transcript_38552/g.94842 Transcript_38552/m.94842 type:complete len:341 (+) Transcript_38552:410-1432(+)
MFEDERYLPEIENLLFKYHLKKEKKHRYRLEKKNITMLEGNLLYLNDNFMSLNFIGKGTYGKVFRMKEIKNSKIFAGKELEIFGTFEYILSIYLREIKIILSFQHPNIVFAKEIRFSKSFNRIFILMEYCEHTLASKIISNRECKNRLSLLSIRRVIRQLLLGIDILHKNGVVHRDLKPHNILVNNRNVYKICDFGLARFFFIQNIPMSGNIVSLWYRAPELLLFEENLSGTSIDTWSIGCIFGELILDKILFQGKNEIDQLQKIFNVMGLPNSDIWINLHFLPFEKISNFKYQPFNRLKKVFQKTSIDSNGIDLLQRLLTFDPLKRISIRGAINHPFFY